MHPGFHSSKEIKFDYFQKSKKIPGTFRKSFGEVTQKYQNKSGNNESFRRFPGRLGIEENFILIPGKFQKSSREVSEKFQECFRNIPGEFQKNPSNISKNSENISEKFQESFGRIPGRLKFEKGFRIFLAK